MSSRLILLLFPFLLISLSTSAKNRFVESKIHFSNGTVKECLILLPLEAGDARLTIRDDENSKRETVNSDDIDRIVVSANQGNFVIERSLYYNRKLNKTFKLSKRKAWLMLTRNCEKLKSYIGIAGFDIDRHGNFIELYLDAMGGYLIQRKSEDYPYIVGFKFITDINQKVYSKQRKKMLEGYFAGDKEALKYLDSKSMVTEEDLDKYLDSRCEL